MASPGDDPPIAGFLQTFPWLPQAGMTLTVAGFVLLLMPWERPRTCGYPLFFLGLIVLILCIVCEFALNQVYWKSKRREQRIRLAELAGKTKGRKQVWVTKLREMDVEKGVVMIEVRKEVRKRVRL